MVKLIVVVVLALCATGWTLPSSLSLSSTAAADANELKSDNGSVLEKSVPCNPEMCQPPKCRCSSIDLDDSIPLQDTPQVSIINRATKHGYGNSQQYS